MKTIAAGLQTHLDGEVTTLATCVKITLVNGTIMGFTTHTKDLVVSGQTYDSATGQSPSSIVTSGDMSVDNLEIVTILDAVGLNEADIDAGLFDGAKISVFLVNYNSPNGGSVILRTGRIGDIQIKDGIAIAEMRGLMQHLQQTIGLIYTVDCRHDLGDAGCKFTIVPDNGTVTGVTNNRVFTDSSRAEAFDHYRGGTVEFTSGLNTGFIKEVKTFLTGAFTLWEAMPYVISIGDTYTAKLGCQKRFVTDCINKFNNGINFGGFPHVPGVDEATAIPVTQHTTITSDSGGKGGNIPKTTSIPTTTRIQSVSFNWDDNN